MEDTIKVCNSFIKGEVQIIVRDGATNKPLWSSALENTVTRGGADILASIMSWDKRMFISHVYAAYKNGTVSDAQDRFNTSETAVASDYHSISGSLDWVRLPIYVSPKISLYPSNDTTREGNRVTFFATTASSVQQGESSNHLPFGPGGSGITASNIFQIALVSAPTPENFLNDKIFSVKRIDVPIPMRSGEYIDILWSLTFN